METDCAIFLIDHDTFKIFDLENIKNLMNYPVVIDCKNIFSEIDGIIYIGLGKGNCTSKPLSKEYSSPSSKEIVVELV